MSGIRTYKNLEKLVARLRDDLNQNETLSSKKVVNKPVTVLLIYAYNRTGKTRLSMEFKNKGKRKSKKNPNAAPDTLYFNAYTEDLFTWENDLDGDTARHLRLNPDSNFFNGLKDLALDETIAGYLSSYADFDFDIDYVTWKVSFRNGDAENIKISRGEQNIFIWCLFMAICERMLDGHISYQTNNSSTSTTRSPRSMITMPSLSPAISPNSCGVQRAGQIRMAIPRPSKLCSPPITRSSST